MNRMNVLALLSFASLSAVAALGGEAEAQLLSANRCQNAYNVTSGQA